MRHTTSPLCVCSFLGYEDLDVVNPDGSRPEEAKADTSDVSDTSQPLVETHHPPPQCEQRIQDCPYASGPFIGALIVQLYQHTACA